MQIMHFEKFYVATMSTGVLKDDETLKVPSDSILEGSYNVTKFPGGAYPD